MGNLVSASGQNLATVAVSNYMSITKNQVVQIRNEVLALTNQEGKIRRHFFAIAVAKARVAIYPDVCGISREIRSYRHKTLLLGFVSLPVQTTPWQMF